MLTRVLIIVVVNAAFLIAVLWYVPIEGILAARGYTPAQIAALKSAAKPDKAGTAGTTTAPPPGKTRAGKPSGLARPDTQAGGDAQAAAAGPDNAASGQASQPPRLVATATINIRAGRGTNHPVVGQVSSGDVVIVLNNPGGDWVRIQHGELRGWGYRPLFKAANSTTDDTATTDATAPVKLVATATINVRAGQGTNHRVVGRVAPGDVVTVLKDPGGDWVRIQHGQLRGWAYRPLFETAAGRQ